MLTQHNQLWNEIRAYNKSIWQIPSVIGVINSILILIASPQSQTFPYLRSFILLVALVLNVTMIVSFYKHNLFQEVKFDERTRIEEILESKYGAEHIVWGTTETLDGIRTGAIVGTGKATMIHAVRHNKWPYRFLRWRAYDFLSGSMWFMVFLIVILLVWSVGTFISFIPASATNSTCLPTTRSG